MKLLTGNVQDYVFLGGHKILYTPLIIHLTFFLQGYYKGLYTRGVGTPSLLHSGGQKWPEAIGWGQGGFHKGQAALFPARWIATLGWRLQVVVLTLVVEQGQFWNLPSHWWSLQGRGTLTVSPLGMAFGHLQADWAAPGGCHPGGEGLWYLVPSPSYPHLWRVVNLVGLLCALLWLTTSLTHAGKQKSMLPLCVEVRGGSSMILWNTVWYLENWCEIATVCQAEPSYRRWWNAGWRWSSFNFKGFKHVA